VFECGSNGVEFEEHACRGEVDRGDRLHVRGEEEAGVESGVDFRDVGREVVLDVVFLAGDGLGSDADGSGCFEVVDAVFEVPDELARDEDIVLALGEFGPNRPPAHSTRPAGDGLNRHSVKGKNSSATDIDVERLIASR
jgi:hypothetical protein